MTYYYKYYNHIIKSNIEHKQKKIKVKKNKEPSFSLEIINKNTKMLKLKSFRWIHRIYNNSAKAQVSIGKNQKYYVYRMHGFADFKFTKNGSKLFCYPLKKCLSSYIEGVITNQAIPLALSLQGKFFLHSSAVLTHKGVVAFVANSGSGKSTLAASFQNKGHIVVADDALLLENLINKIKAYNSGSELRLSDFSAKHIYRMDKKDIYLSDRSLQGKIRINLKPKSLKAINLKSIFLLGPDSKKIGIKKLMPKKAILELLKHFYRLGIDKSDKQKTELEFACLLVENIPVFEIAYPRKWSQIDIVHKKIMNVVESGL